MKNRTLVILIGVAMLIAGIVLWNTHSESAAAFIWAYISVFALMGLSEHIEELRESDKKPINKLPYYKKHENEIKIIEKEILRDHNNYTRFSL